MQLFDLTESPLQGINLIEASAGTGKTYTITGLYLRFLLESGFSIDQILVVTFTKAATEELKDRIRATLKRAKKDFERSSSDDDLIDQLLQKFTDTASAVRSLDEALANYDQAQIYTIHGFCHKILNEYCFETGNLFDTTLLKDPTGFILEVADDFWRKILYQSQPEWVQFVVSQKITGPEYFMGLLGARDIESTSIIPQLPKPELISLEPFRRCLHRLRQLWSTDRQVILRLLHSPNLNGTIYGSVKTPHPFSGSSRRDMQLNEMAKKIDILVSYDFIGFPLFKHFSKLTTSAIKQYTRKNKTPEKHPFFDVCDTLHNLGQRLEDEMAARLQFYKTEFFRFAKRALEQKKQHQNCQFFSDLLVKLNRALDIDRSNQSYRLTRTIQQAYKVALIDEFQDTDFIQYNVFSKIFSAKDSILFLIGDPKQAIYGFRGADIFSYLQAAAAANSKYTLFYNWRSTPAMIKAVNCIFNKRDRPFVLNHIDFVSGQPVTSNAPESESHQPALHLWYLSSEQFSTTSKPIPKSKATDIVAEAVVAEISKLLQCKLPSHNPGDIAVLVRTNQQALLMRQRLASVGIPASIQSDSSIFESHEAREVLRILKSIATPNDETRFRTALVTDILGVAADQLNLNSLEPAWWHKRYNRFQKYHDQWHRTGFTPMFRQFLSQEHVKERLLAQPDGERRLTNVLHLGELLHFESHQHHLGMGGLIRWFASQIKQVTRESDAHLLRLESDEHTVQIITIHKSKGLEYPVVFCPFNWDASHHRGKDRVAFHDPDNIQNYIVDLGSDRFKRHFKLGEKEQLAENLRLLYVALTRARKKCYLAWGHINLAETSALAYLFHSRHTGISPGLNADEIVQRLKTLFKLVNDEDLQNDLRRLIDQSDGSIQMTLLQPGRWADIKKTPKAFDIGQLPKFEGHIDRTWKLASYSAMIAPRLEHYTVFTDTDQPDGDEMCHDVIGFPEPNATHHFTPLSASTPKSIFAFPRGAHVGSFFHALFEEMDFQQDSASYFQNLIQQKLDEYGFISEWTKTIQEMVHNVLTVPLINSQPSFNLTAIKDSDCQKEMEFYYPLRLVRNNILKQKFNKYGHTFQLPEIPRALGKLDFAPMAGYMKGYIDLIIRYGHQYFIIDWKSNWLGNSFANYHQESISRSMVQGYYFLQYHLYTLALHQVLRQRQPDYRYENHFGGVIYLYIRGINPAQGSEYGVFRDMPSLDFINTLGETLIPSFKMA